MRPTGFTPFVYSSGGSAIQLTRTCALGLLRRSRRAARGNVSIASRGIAVFGRCGDPGGWNARHVQWRVGSL